LIEEHVLRAGMTILGGLDAAGKGISGLPAGTVTLLLIGWGGPDQWRYFAASPEYTDGKARPLDRWTQRVVDRLAADLGAAPLYPFSGPPWLPFQAWALAAGIGYKSPIGLLIHPRYGLSHSYRAALAFDQPITLPPAETAASPCDTCVGRPCLTTCPVGAYTEAGFAVDTCRTYIRTMGKDCRDNGCQARAACPVGRDYRYTAEQIRFHQRAFVNA
jgi:epoxyqueuosine reductase QueG